jgi:MFS family permease
VTRDFRLLWTGQTVSQLGTSASRVAAPLVAVTVLHASALQVSLLSAAAWLPWLVIGILAGTLVDRLPRRPILVGCDLLCAALMLSAPIAAWLGLLTVGQLLLVLLLVGVCDVFSSTAGQVYIPAVVEADGLAAANARLHGGASAAGVAGPGAAGLLAHLGGAVTALFADALSYVVSAVCLLRMRTRDRVAPDPGREPMLAAARTGLRFAARDPYLRVLAGYGGLSNLALTAFQAIMVVFLVRTVGFGAGLVGLVLTLGSLGGVLGAAVSGRLSRRFGSARALLGCELAAGVFALLMPLTTAGWGATWLIVGDFGLAAGVVAGNVINGSFRQRYCPPELLGRVTATMRVLNYGTMPLAAVLGGTLATVIGLRATMWVGCGGVLAAALVLLAGPLKSHRELPERMPGGGGWVPQTG